MAQVRALINGLLTVLGLLGLQKETASLTNWNFPTSSTSEPINGACPLVTIVPGVFCASLDLELIHPFLCAPESEGVCPILSVGIPVPRELPPTFADTDCSGHQSF